MTKSPNISETPLVNLATLYITGDIQGDIHGTRSDSLPGQQALIQNNKPVQPVFWCMQAANF